MRKILPILLLFAPSCSSSSSVAPPEEEPPAPVESCRKFSIYSNNVGSTLSVEIALPEGYATAPDDDYPSIYLLDANYFFDGAPGTLDELLERGPGMTRVLRDLTAAGDVPPSILVGIGYSEEQRMALTIEDVDAFLGFFTDELIPGIESRCRVKESAQDRVLFGYSASAHFSSYVLFHDVYTGASTFDKVISISGLYMDFRPATVMEEQIHEEMDASAFSGRELFMAVGSEDGNTGLLDTHRVFTEKLSGRGYEGFRLQTLEFTDKGHYDIPEYAFGIGLAWIFSG